MGIKTFSDNISLNERLRRDNLSTPINPLQMPSGSVIQVAHSMSQGATNITSNFADWVAINASECSIVPYLDDSLLLYQTRLQIEYDSGSMSNAYYFLKAYRDMPQLNFDSTSGYAALNPSKQYGHAGTDTHGATGTMTFSYVDDTWDFKAGMRVWYKVYFHAMNISDGQSIHFGQNLTDTDGGGQDYCTQNTIMEIKR